MADENGTTAVVPQSQTGIRPRKKATLVDVAGQLKSSDGRWHPDLAVEYMLLHAEGRTVEVAELARIFCGSNNKTNRARVRRNMARLFRDLWETYNELLVYEMDGPRIGSVKIFDPQSPADWQNLQPKLQRMTRLAAIACEVTAIMVRLEDIRREWHSEDEQKVAGGGQ
jgi:hypothetical protein